MEDVPSVTLLVSKKSPSNQQLVRFHLSLPMGYFDSAPYFCIATNMVADLVNKTIAQRDVARAYPLEQSAEARATDDAGVPEAQSDASWE